MTTHRAIASTETQPEAPITAALMRALALNLLATMEGSTGAPNLQFPALGTLVAGSTIRSRIDAVQSASTAGSDVPAMLFGFAQPGVIRLSCEHQHGGGTTSSVSISFRRWRVNTWTNLVTHTIPNLTTWTARTLDIDVIPGDTIGAFMTAGAGGSISQIRNIRLSTNGGLLWPFPTLTPLE